MTRTMTRTRCLGMTRIAHRLHARGPLGAGRGGHGCPVRARCTAQPSSGCPARPCCLARPGFLARPAAARPGSAARPGPAVRRRLAFRPGLSSPCRPIRPGSARPASAARPASGVGGQQLSVKSSPKRGRVSWITWNRPLARKQTLVTNPDSKPPGHGGISTDVRPSVPAWQARGIVVGHGEGGAAPAGG